MDDFFFALSLPSIALPLNKGVCSVIFWVADLRHFATNTLKKEYSVINSLF
jgi:hypothetical protein